MATGLERVVPTQSRGEWTASPRASSGKMHVVRGGPRTTRKSKDTSPGEESNHATLSHHVDMVAVPGNEDSMTQTRRPQAASSGTKDRLQKKEKRSHTGTSPTGNTISPEGHRDESSFVTSKKSNQQTSSPIRSRLSEDGKDSLVRKVEEREVSVEHVIRDGKKYIVRKKIRRTSSPKTKTHNVVQAQTSPRPELAENTVTVSPDSHHELPDGVPFQSPKPPRHKLSTSISPRPNHAPLSPSEPWNHTLLESPRTRRRSIKEAAAMVSLEKSDEKHSPAAVKLSPPSRQGEGNMDSEGRGSIKEIPSVVLLEDSDGDSPPTTSELSPPGRQSEVGARVFEGRRPIKEVAAMVSLEKPEGKQDHATTGVRSSPGRRRGEGARVSEGRRSVKEVAALIGLKKSDGKDRTNVSTKLSPGKRRSAVKVSENKQSDLALEPVENSEQSKASNVASGADQGQAHQVASKLDEESHESRQKKRVFEEDDILKVVNAEREKLGLTALQRNKSLDELALSFAQIVANSLGQESIHATHFGNVLRGSSLEAIHAASLIQENERSNLLNGVFTHFGMGTVEGQDGFHYLCQLFSFQTVVLTCQNCE